MLADGAALTMPPIPTWYQGQAAVAAFLARVPLAGPSRRRLVPTRANGQPAFGSYNWDAERKGFVPHEILCSPRRRPDRGDHRFLSTEPFERFGLPAALALPQ
jgi:RNA polymerase sigma-70 factor, ECF subfamily